MKNFIDELRILGSTNTQTHRLGYVIQLCQILAQNQAPGKVLQNEIERWAKNNNHFLKDYVSDKGRLEPSQNSYGAKRYIQLTKNLELIIDLSGNFRPTIIGQLLNVLSTEYVEKQNPFVIPVNLSFILFYQMMLLDADYLLELLSLSLSFSNQNEYISHFQETIQNRLQIMEGATINPLLRAKIRDRRQTTEQWKKPEVYLEHIVLPRLNWLVDLNIFDRNSLYALKKFELSKQGKVIFSETPYFESHRFIDRDWCQNGLFELWAKAFYGNNIKKWDILTLMDKEAYIHDYVQHSFNLFGSTGKQRVSAYQIILYVMIHLLNDYQVIATFDTLKKEFRSLARNSKAKWNFYWSTIDNDGYLLKR
ncbi:MAG: hypothetical protein PVF83_12260 [Anaerolineales bacterium]|jgi:hypothetical protein